MTPAISFEELLAWNEETSDFWKAHLDANPTLLQLPCGIGGAEVDLVLVDRQSPILAASRYRTLIFPNQSA